MWWVTSLLDETLWKASLSDAPKDFVVRYRLSLPRPECQPHADHPDIQLCFKSLARGYRVTGEGGLVDRNIAFDLEIELDGRWRMTRATLAGTSLFLGTREAREQKALDSQDEALRRDVATEFVNALTQVMAEREVACNGGSDAEGHTVLECGALRLTVEPGKVGGDDIIYVEPLAAAPHGTPPPAGDADADDDADADAPGD
jgi:hypothetical protein